MPAPFTTAIERHDNSLAHIGRPGSFADRGIGFGELRGLRLERVQGGTAEGVGRRVELPELGLRQVECLSRRLRLLGQLVPYTIYIFCKFAN